MSKWQIDRKTRSTRNYLISTSKREFGLNLRHLRNNYFIILIGLITQYCPVLSPIIAQLITYTDMQHYSGTLKRGKYQRELNEL